MYTSQKLISQQHLNIFFWLLQDGGYISPCTSLSFSFKRLFNEELWRIYVKCISCNKLVWHMYIKFNIQGNNPVATGGGGGSYGPFQTLFWKPNCSKNKIESRKTIFINEQWTLSSVRHVKVIFYIKNTLHSFDKV